MELTLAYGDPEAFLEGVLGVLAVDALIVKHLGVRFELDHSLSDVLLVDFVGSDESEEVGLVGEGAALKAEFVKEVALHFLSLFLLKQVIREHLFHNLQVA